MRFYSSDFIISKELFSNEVAMPRSRMLFAPVLCLFTLLIFSRSSGEDVGSGRPDSTTDSASLTLAFKPGDALIVSVLPDTGFLNNVFLIDDQGRCDFPVIGFVKVTDYTPRQLSEKLRQDFIDYLRYPSLKVRPLMRVTMLGGFNRPGLYYLEPRANLWDAVHRAGGMAREDGIKKMRWERGKEIVSDDLVEHFESGKSLQAIGFQSGDQIWMTTRPKRYFWDIFRQDVLPLITFALSTVSTTATVYLTVDAILNR